VDRDERRTREIGGSVTRAKRYRDAAEMLERERPDAVHVLTPPATHAAVAILAMEAGCHVLVEKPMALSTAEVDEMTEVAERVGVTLSTCHNYLFKPSVAKALCLVNSGAVGDPVSVINYYGVSPQESSLATGAGSHWSWRLPGGVFTNFLPHLLYLHRAFGGEIEEFSGVIVGADPHDGRQLTELFALSRGARANGSLTVSARVAPYMKYVDVFCTGGVVRADLVREVCVVQRRHQVPGLVAKVLFNLEYAVQLVLGTLVSTTNVLTGRWQSMPELSLLIADYYAGLASGRSPTVTAADGRAMVQAMEQLWAAAPALQRDSTGTAGEDLAPQPETAVEQRLAAGEQLPGRVLVTGANGFLGQQLVAALARSGTEVVALVRDRTRAPFAVERHAEVVESSLEDPQALKEAMAGVDLVYHCAAVTTNSATWEAHHATNVLGTAQVMDAAAAAGVRRVVHVSSVIVYGLDPPAHGHALGEAAPYGSDRDHYAYYQRSKVQAEEEAKRRSDESGVGLTIVRPGILYGPGHPLKARLVQFGIVSVVLGTGRNRLPATYVGNAVDALLLAGSLDEADGETFNVVDEPAVTVREILKHAAPGERMLILPVPPSLLTLVASRLERRARGGGLQRPPKLSRFVVRTATRDIAYDTRMARELLGWRPEVPLNEGLRRV
jgi:nucleoside-diphosphate-sugar epimerase